MLVVVEEHLVDIVDIRLSTQAVLLGHPCPSQMAQWMVVQVDSSFRIQLYSVVLRSVA